jgi:hypothetical protein
MTRNLSANVNSITKYVQSDIRRLYQLIFGYKYKLILNRIRTLGRMTFIYEMNFH